MRVTVSDVNEFPPAFSMSVYATSIQEQSASETSVIDVSSKVSSVPNKTLILTMSSVVIVRCSILAFCGNRTRCHNADRIHF